MFCNRCGSELNPQTNLCPNCSQSQGSAGDEFTATQWSSGTNDYPTGNNDQEQSRNYANFQSNNISDYDRTVGGFVPEQGSNNYANQPCANYGFIQQQNSANTDFIPAVKSGKEKKVRTKSTGFIPAIIISVMLVITIICVGVIAAYKLDLIPAKDKDSSSSDTNTTDPKDSASDNSKENSGKDTKETLSGEVITHVNNTNNLEKDLNSYISENFANTSDVAVCVIDNKTNKMYSTDHAGDQYTAWGFYLPIYMVLDSEYPGEYDSTRRNIVSTDIATCNAYSNKGIDYLGGFSAINTILAEDYNLFATTYGRKFGDTLSQSDNYTTPEDAAMLLKELNDSGDYAVLNHNAGSYGISAPDSANTIYAHIGSENRYVNKTFNMFSVVKGRADCCIVIMTKNQTRATGVAKDIYSIVLNNLK